MMRNYPSLDDFSFFKIGLGCSRIGSMTGPTPLEAEALIRRAHELGIRVFDTARSYGQGDSERLLGRTLKGASDTFIITKIGKLIPLKAKIMQPMKTLVRSFGKRSDKVSAAVAQTRGGLLPVSFDTRTLQKQLDQSRRALGRDMLDAVMLHSASADILLQGTAMDFLERAQSEGVIKALGVSVDNIEAAEATLGDPRISLVQAPFHLGDIQMANWAHKAREAGKIVVAREIFNPSDGTAPNMTSSAMGSVLRQHVNANEVGICLVGTTKLHHLEELVSLARNSSL